MKIRSAFLDLSQDDKWTDREGKANKHVSANRSIHSDLIETNSSLHPLVHNLATAEQSPYPALGFEKCHIPFLTGFF
jgi:hypothetical protein